MEVVFVVFQCDECLLLCSDVDSVVKEKIAAQLDLDDRIDITAQKQAFITLKDHKDNFPNRDRKNQQTDTHNTYKEITTI